MLELKEYIDSMNMSYSYKPVLLLALVQHKGVITIKEAAAFFRRFYGERIRYGLVAEKDNSIFSTLKCDDNEIESNIIANPVRALMNSCDLFSYENKTLSVRQPLEDIAQLIHACYDRLYKYYSRIDMQPRILCFHKPEEENGYLSNWYPSGFMVDGRAFSSTEQYLMYYKAMIFDDMDIAQGILHTDDVARIQQLGRAVKGYDEKVWSANRQIIAYRGNLKKFEQNAQLRDKLILTQNDILAECSISDKVWGIGVGMNDENRQNMDFWSGKNLLGYTLMQVRNELSA